MHGKHDMVNKKCLKKLVGGKYERDEYINIQTLPYLHSKVKISFFFVFINTMTLRNIPIENFVVFWQRLLNIHFFLYPYHNINSRP